ncbi:MAG TPA: CsgG/HfaB family protein [Longimicrobiales bacterium]
MRRYVPAWSLAGPLVATALAAAACAPAFRPVAAPAPADVPALEARLARDSSDVDAMISLAAAYRVADRLAEARRLLERANSLRPDDPDAVFYLGLTYEDLERYDDAARFYRRYIAVGGSAPLKSRLEARLRLLEHRRLLAAVRRALADEAELAAAPPQPSTVAVFPFLFAAADSTLRPLSRALAELLVTDLSQTDRLTVLERTRVQLLLDEMRLARTGVVDPATAARSGRLLGAGRIVQSRIEGDETALRLEAAVVDVARGTEDARVTPVTQEDALRDLFDMEKRLALDIYRTLGVELTVAERERVQRRPTENVRALLEFGLGLAEADEGRFAAAAAHFSRAAELDPAFELARARAAAAAAMAAAAGTSTRRLAQDGTTASLPSIDFGLLDELVPNFGGRDAASELLGSEGVDGRAAILQIILRVR